MVAIIFFILGIVGGILMWGRLNRLWAGRVFAYFGIIRGLSEFIWPTPPQALWFTLVCAGLVFIALLLFTKPDIPKEDG